MSCVVTRRFFPRVSRAVHSLSSKASKSVSSDEVDDSIGFEILHKSTKEGSHARVGRVTTVHGSFLTPHYVAVGTNGALKAVEWHAARDEGLDVAFCNTYHLMLHPGVDVIQEAGGLHRFMNRHAPLMTDSGGFQVFSLAYGTVHDELHFKASLKRRHIGHIRSGRQDDSGKKVLKISEQGVVFKSYRDGTTMLLTPESSVLAQKSLGADIILPLDELPPYHIGSREELQWSTHRSHTWEERSLGVHLQDRRHQRMLGIVHGGSDLDLRKESVDFVTSRPFDGYAIGGSLGASADELHAIVKHATSHMDRTRQVHVLGIADPQNIPSLVPYGCDTFDSCYATKIARHGSMMWHDPDGTPRSIRIQSGKYKNCHTALNGCPCYTCGQKGYSLAYLHHLYKAREPIYQTLVSLHNISYMCRMMADIRSKILRNQL